MENPLLKYKNDTNDSYIRFDLIKDEHFEPAFEVALITAKENLQKIIDNHEVPTFENTIEALEYVSEDLDHISAVFGVFKESHTNKEIDRVAQVIFPKLTDFSNDISLNEKLFMRVKAVYESNPVNLTKEQKRLLEKSYKGFTRNGALLSDADKKIMREYDNRLTTLSNTFAENLLGATNAYELHITDPSGLSGLPERVKDMAYEEAKSRNKEGWVFTLKAPSVGPFMQYADNVDLRKEISLVAGARGMNAPYDNRSIVLEIVKLRKARANLLGYLSHAHFVLENRMAKKPENVEKFFSEMFQACRVPAEKDFEMLRSYKENTNGEKELHPWDTAYYGEKIKKEHFDFDEEAFRPYFKLESVLDGVFEHAKLLYGLSFIERKEIPVYHSDVKVFEVRNEGNMYVGLLYMDLFPRESKRGGAWADTIRTQYKKSGDNIPPHLLLVGSLTKPTSTIPALLTSDDVLTIFHEFGHGLHVLLSDCQYKSLAGYNTLWDFVELPSQLMQSWLTQKESLKLFAKHYKTGESLPNELIEKLLKADRFMTAWVMLAQIGASVVDMAWHNEKADTVNDIESFEDRIRKPYRLFDVIPGTSTSTSFKHIFDGGYSAGYYSYHWAEVLAADAFEYFKEEGLFSKEIAEKFRANVLSKGNTEEPLELYRAFRGRDADPKALFRHKGLI